MLPLVRDKCRDSSRICGPLNIQNLARVGQRLSTINVIDSCGNQRYDYCTDAPREDV